MSSFTLIDLETDVLEGGVIAALDLSQDLHDVFHFGALELQRRGDSRSVDVSVKSTLASTVDDTADGRTWERIPSRLSL